MSPRETETLEEPLTSAIQEYWNKNIHDQDVATHPIGTTAFFQELDDYRFHKLSYLPKLVDFSSYQGKQLLEVGCGLGIDLVRFARAGAQVTGIDLSATAIELARSNFAGNGLTAALQVMDGEALGFKDSSFDAVYAHGVLQYAADARTMIKEIYRVLRPSGQAILMVYNKYSWLSALSRISKVELEHQDAPAFRTYSKREYMSLLHAFEHTQIVPERFPVRTRLHSGLKAKLFNVVFVGSFNRLPYSVVKPLGWHLMAFAIKPWVPGST
ncbi:MAG: class I SAM-dependent methyltransferase [Chloroflexota bacterium]|nr:MAG: class I SAM-dependent methyltransferase [Chloroflexota bacterium]